MILSVHKERTDNLDPAVVPNEFCFGKQEQLSTFGNLQQKDIPVMKDVIRRSITTSNNYLL